MFAVTRDHDVRAGADVAFETMHGPRSACPGPLSEDSDCIHAGLPRGEHPRHDPTIDRRVPPTHPHPFRDTARDRYARVNAPRDTLTLAERCLGRYETPC